ncbi:MAG TPA: hypothetical protein VKO18_19470 [Terriglobia bacterium]|nr:hypothetical protein [Terriglobia bacterium]
MALISDGFLRGTHAEQVDGLVRALRGGLTLTTLDARGLCNILPAGDPTRPSQRLSRQGTAP